MYNRTIDDCLVCCVDNFPDKIAITDMDCEYTWKEVDYIVDVLAQKILGMGIKAGDHIAIWASNSASYILYFMAIQRVGGVAVLINMAYKWRELESILKNYDVNYILYTRKYKDSDHENTINMLDRDKFKELRGTCIFDDERDNLKDLLKIPKKKIETNVHSEDVACIFFTSGTTGMAKGVMLTHNNLVNNSKDIIERMTWDERDRMCLAVPLFHCFGITVGILGAIHTGMTMDVARKFSTGTVFRIIEEKKCTLFNGVPTMFLAMMNSSKREQFDLTSLKGGLMAGSSILPYEYMDICNTFGFKNLQTAFGQTESSPAITTSLITDSVECKAYSAGKKLDNVEVRIVKDGIVCGVYDEGEIQTRGYHVMRGYYNMPEETKKAIDENGWLSTGDLGYLDKDGYLHVTGRIKDIIVRGGENISPMEIENVIVQFDEIKSVKVVGVPAKVIQEEVVACIVWKDDRRLSKETIISSVKKQLADYKAPKYIFDFEKIPQNSTGKVLVKDLVRMCEEKLL